MSDLEDALKALRAADKAGNVEDAKRLAGIADRLSREQESSGMDYVRAGVSGFNVGLAEMAGAPVDLVNLGLDAVGFGTKEPIGGSKFLKGLMPEEWTPEPPDNPVGRTIHRAGKEIGATALPAVGMMGAAARGVGKAGTITGTIMQPLRATPGRAAVAEVASATGAGIGAQIARETSPGNKTAEMTGQVVGGLAPAALALSPTAVIARAARKAVKRFSPAAQRAEARQQVAEVMGDAMTDEAQRNLADAARLRGEIKGFDPSLAEATGSQPLIASQKATEAAASGADLDRIVGRRTASEAAVAGFAENVAPGRRAPPDAIVDTARRTIEDLRSAVRSRQTGVGQAREELAGRLPRTDKASAGAVVRERLLGARDQARGDMNRLADELGINDTDVTEKFRHLRETILADVKPGSRFEDVSNYPAVLETLKKTKPGSVVTFRDLKALRERISDDIMDAMSGASPSRKKVRTLTMMRENIDKAIEELAQGGIPSASRQAPPQVENLTAWVHSQGGLREFRGELEALGISNRTRPGMVSGRGMELDDAAHRAWEHGYFPDHSERPDINDFLRALGDDFNGVSPRYREIDQESVQAFEAAMRAQGEGVGDLAGRYREFREAYFEGYIKRFEQGAAFKVRQKNGRGFYVTPDERVAESFFQPGNVSAARQFKTAFGVDPEAQGALEAVALDSLRDHSIRDGLIDPKRLADWTRRHASVLDEFPALRQKIQTLETADGALLRRQAELEMRHRQIGEQLLTRELDAYGKATRDAGSVLDAAMKDPRKMVQLVRVLRETPPALEALRRTIWDRVVGGTSADIYGFIRDNHRTLRPLFSQQHLRNLATVARARAMHERVPTPTGAAFVPRPLGQVERAVGQGIPQLGSRIFAFKSGRMQKGYLVLDTFLRGLRGRAAADAEDMFREALYDPRIAQDLMETVKTARLPADRAARLAARAFRIGITPSRVAAVGATTLREE